MDIKWKHQNPGESNNLPKGLTLLSEAEFAKSGFFIWVIESHEYRNIYRSDSGEEYPYGSKVLIRDSMNLEREFPVGMKLHMFWMEDQGGYAIYNDSINGKVYYFLFGCQHKNERSLSIEECRSRSIYHAGRCYQVFECPDCGRINAIDSSD